MITIYTICYNEEVMLPHFIKHYRDRFKGCRIVIYDNYSTDNSEKIALDNNCEVIKFDTGNTFSELKHISIKNNEWKNAKTNWVLVCDVDEFLDIDELLLIEEEKRGTTIIKGYGYDMINNEPYVIDVDNMLYGVKNNMYDKCLLFNKSKIIDINYDGGCHNCNPKGIVIFNTNQYIIFHNTYVEENYRIKRYKSFNSRISKDTPKDWNTHYNKDEERIINDFRFTREKAIKLKK